MKPMCAFKWQDYKNSLSLPYYIQPKLNGVRALYRAGQMQSRGLREEEGKLWNPKVVTHLLSELEKVIPSNWLTDGELYLHGKSLQQINSAIAVNRADVSAKSHEIEYHIFDIIDTSRLLLPFHDRASLLHSLQEKLIINRCAKVKVVPTTLITQHELAETLYSHYRQQNYEGIMYRNALTPYGFAENCGNKENRWKYLLKRKGWMDEEFLITGFNRTVGDKGNPGFQLTCVTSSGQTFTVGSGLSQEMQNFYEQHPPINQLAKVRFEMYSDTGVPLKPTLEAILDNE